MITLNIQGKEINFISYSLKSHLKTNDLISLNSLEIDTSTKITKWTYNSKYESGTRYIQSICPICNVNLFSTTTTRLINEIKNGNQNITFICRSCSVKNNIKKIDMNKRAQQRAKNWENKTDEERSSVRKSISNGKLKYANITDDIINNAIIAYTIDKKPLSVIRDILGVAGKHTAKKILVEHGIITRDFSAARSIYLQNNKDKNPFTRSNIIEKIKEYRKDHPIERDGKPSKEEIDFFNKIIGNKKQHKRLNGRQFDVLIDDDRYIEFDGTFWHGKDGGSYSFPQIHTMLNDEYKNNLIIQEKKSLYRVWSDTIFDTYTMSEIRDKSYYIIENGNLIKDEKVFKDIIVEHEYVHSMLAKHPGKFEDNMQQLLTFVRTFYSFPWVNSQETLEQVIKKIQENKDKQLKSSIRIGNDYLKTYFKSCFYVQRGKKKKSMYDAFYDDQELMKIIKNRLGITYKEKWDLSLETIRRGFYSNYYGVSIFNSVNAYNIYKKIAKPSDTILDMSCGFGGRLLGWQAFQKCGKYIGYEPNKATYDELITFSKGMNVELYNLPFEECLTHKVDICFSCPPYFDTEVYCNDKNQSIYGHITFDSWIEWLKDCINKMHNMTDKVYLVVNKRIKDKLDCKVIDTIKNKESHFTGKENYEYLIKV